MMALSTTTTTTPTIPCNNVPKNYFISALKRTRRHFFGYYIFPEKWNESRGENDETFFFIIIPS